MRGTILARAGLALALAGALAACTGGPPRTMQIGRGMTTPDEFAILPGKPIEMPPSLNELPAPTPFGANRADATPIADAVAALGGSPARLQSDGRTPDGAVVSYSGRYGVDPQVRVRLAEEDYKYRDKHRGRLMERLFRVPTYYKGYREQELDQHAAQEYYRRSNVPTAAAPPEASEFD
ncbi:DUF3035 domain-containing protein [Tropicimonas sp.]|uniref:DUF3035 domain-containing protein n=1 Tax=Tropicimonas sp. TaxID=2067044 RepID=UPI003A88F601